MEKPSIRPTAETQPFWQGCRDRKLRYQTCDECGAVQRIPRSVCTHCHGQQLKWNESAGLGTVLSHTTVHRAPNAAFKAEAPYVIALVDLDEGFRLMVNTRNDANSPLAIGQRVRIGFEPRGDHLLPIAEPETP
ncbi:Zn-ribbon domain-containing OB-fold protein [Achromobacter aegrifaciens]|uniref:OB-fold domain-containing protein n=1 Tax=Achromobacter aegrifaciens TaxID=1287736 RepID=A0ABU2DLZ2_ACHAE|nr:OB-fold domain-containing protein [Achromobacter aegrifaciens]MDR7949093.1 OB-fold domain-containing protein [Achromobacter aegrifaciens]